MEKGRIAALDAGRAIAVVGVVAVHLSFQFPNLPDSVALIARMGQYGVQLFFVISAITIFMTLEADRERFSAARHITLRFYIKRFFRIAPLYYVAIAIYGLISWGASRSGYERAWVLGAHSPADILLNVLFLHALSPSAINNVVPGGWSIGVEMVLRPGSVRRNDIIVKNSLIRGFQICNRSHVDIEIPCVVTAG